MAFLDSTLTRLALAARSLPPSVVWVSLRYCGTCVNIGCVPSKALIRAAEHCYHAVYSQFVGLTACPPPRNWQRVVEQKDELVAALRQGKYVDVAAAYPNISLLKGSAELTEGRRLAIGEKAYHPGKIIIATGSKPWAPPIPGLAKAGFLDSTNALSLPKLSLIVIGAGAIGLELAQLYHGRGAETCCPDVSEGREAPVMLCRLMTSFPCSLPLFCTAVFLCANALGCLLVTVSVASCFMLPRFDGAPG